MNYPIDTQKRSPRYAKPVYLPAIPPASTPRARQRAAEAALVARMRAGDVAAFEEIVRCNKERVLKIAVGILRDLKDAEEVTQDVFMTIHSRIDRFRGEASLSTWIHRIATNAALMRRRRQKPGQTVSLDDMLPAIDTCGRLGGAEWITQQGDPAVESEMAHLLQDALGRLDEKYRKVFVLRQIEGCTTEETARMLKLRVPAVKTRLHRARMALRRDLGPYFERRVAC